MADEFDANDDVLELTDALPEGEAAPEAEEAGDPDDIILEGEDDGESDDPTIKKIRHAARDALRRAGEAERRAAALEAQLAGGDAADPGPFPSVDDPEFEWDVERVKAAQEKWHKDNAAFKARTEREQRADAERQRAITNLEVAYRTSATRLAPANAAMFDEADKAVRAALGDDAPIAIAGYFKEPAKLIVALHKYPTRLQAIQDEPDNTKKLLLLKEVEMAMKATSTRRAAPPPEAETIQRGSASLSKPATDKHAEKLLEAASKPGGSMDAYYKYMKSKKAA